MIFVVAYASLSLSPSMYACIYIYTHIFLSLGPLCRGELSVASAAEVADRVGTRPPHGIAGCCDESRGELPALQARKLEHDRPPTRNQRKKER